MNTLQKYSPSILRIALSLIFLWFGVTQVSTPNDWVAYVPDWVVNLSHMNADKIVFFNGIFEIVFGSMLLLGLFTRFAAFLLFLHITDITFTVGFDATGVRDFGLTIATLVIWINGSDLLGLDGWVGKSNPTV